MQSIIDNLNITNGDYIESKNVSNDSSTAAAAAAATATATVAESESESESNPIIDNIDSDLGIILADQNQRITHVNSTFESITGYSLLDSIGRNCNFLQGEYTSIDTIQLIRSNLINNKQCSVAILNYRKNGQAFWNLLTISPLMNSAGLIQHYIGIQRCQSIIYIDRPMKLFKWNSNQQFNIKSNNTAAVDDIDLLQHSEYTNNPFYKPKYIKQQQQHQHQQQQQQQITANKLSHSQSNNSIELLKQQQQYNNQIQVIDEDLNSNTNKLINSVIDKSPILSLPTITASAELESKSSSNSTSNNPILKPIKPALQLSTPVQFVAETLLPTIRGKFRVRAYKDQSLLGLQLNREILAIISDPINSSISAVNTAIPLRVHDQCFTSEVLGSLKCDCKYQLESSMDYISNSLNGGIIIYLSQEGRGIGLANKIKAYSVQEYGYDTVDANRILGFPDDCREYTAIPSILADLNINTVPIKLITNNPRKTEILAALGVNIIGRIDSNINKELLNIHSLNYIKSKQLRMNHH